MHLPLRLIILAPCPARGPGINVPPTCSKHRASIIRLVNAHQVKRSNSVMPFICNTEFVLH